MPAGASVGAAGHHVGALGVAAGEVEAAVEEGQVRGHHHVLGAHVGPAAVRTRPPCTCVAIVPSCSGPSSARGEPVQVLHRVELGLVVEAHRARHREWEIESSTNDAGKPEPERDLRLLAQLVDLGAGLGVGVVRLAPQVAVDAELLGKLEHAGDAGLVGVAVRPGGIRAEAARQPAVGEPVQRAQLRGVVAARAGRHAPSLEHRHARALALEQQRRREPDDARAEHRHVNGQVVIERARCGVSRPRTRVSPPPRRG